MAPAMACLAASGPKWPQGAQGALEAAGRQPTFWFLGGLRGGAPQLSGGPGVRSPPVTWCP